MNRFKDKIQYWEPLLRVIRKAEALRGPGQAYDSIEGLKQPLPGLSKKTITEAIRIAPRTHIGAYQFKRTSLPGWAELTGLDPDKDIFNKLNQDSIAIYLISSFRKGENWVSNGPMTTEQFMINLSQEWAGLPVPKDMKGFKRNVKAGESFYAGVTYNASRVTIKEVTDALNLINSNKYLMVTESELELPPSPFTPTPTPIGPPVSITISESEYLQFIQD